MNCSLFHPPSMGWRKTKNSKNNFISDKMVVQQQNFNFSHNDTYENYSAPLNLKNQLPLDVPLFSMCGLNMILHFFGMYLLLRLRANGETTVEQIFLINMSVVECFNTGFSIIIYVSKYFGYSTLHNILLTIHKLQAHALYFSVMWCITLDRLLLVFLDIRYHIYCTERRAKIVVVSTWGFCIVASTLVHIFEVNSAIQEASLLVPFGVMSSTFLIFVIVTYSVIFYKFIRARTSPPQSIQSRQNHIGFKELFNIFRHSRFFLSALLIFSYVVLYVIPTLLFHATKTHPRRKKGKLRVMWMSTVLSYMVDAMIYILSQPNIREICLKLLKRRDEIIHVI